MKRMITLVLSVVLLHSFLYGMKRPASTDLSYKSVSKKIEVDRHPSMFSDEQSRGSIFFGFKVMMDLEYTMPPEELAQFQKNFVDSGITGEDEKGMLLQKFYMAFMNNIHAGRRAKIGGPEKYVVNGEIFFN